MSLSPYAWKSTIRKLLYRVGLLGLLHRRRNRQTLTVFMFHRVLPADSVEYAAAEREFTFSISGFGRCLDFISKHYKVLPHAAVREFILNGKPLPACAGLVTFDDGWRDTLIHALPELKKRQMPGVLFLSTEVIDLAEKRWWQDMLVEALSTAANLNALEKTLGLEADANEDRAQRLRSLTSAFAALDDQRRHNILGSLAKPVSDSRQMLDATDFANLMPDIAIAGHGHSHAPLSHCANPRADIESSRSRLIEIGGDDWAMSFPHGAFDSVTLALARDAGFRVCYTSAPELVNTSPGRKSDIPLGRIHIPENEWTCEDGTISDAMLATYLFLRPVAP